MQLTVSIDYVHLTVVVEQQGSIVEECTFDFVALPVAFCNVGRAIHIGLMLVVCNEQRIVHAIVVAKGCGPLAFAVSILSVTQVVDVVVCNVVVDVADDSPVYQVLGVHDRGTWTMDLFGAMYASNPDVNVESAIEVAPAISIDEVKPTEDYFTAVSSNKNRKGSLHLNSRILCSGFMHFHVKLDLGDLVKKGYTKEELIWIVKTLTEALYFLQFKSGQSGTAHHSIPSLFNVSFSSNVMYLPNYSGLFYRPVNACTDHIKDIDEIVEDIQKKIKLSVDSINRMVDTLCKESLAKVWYHPLSVDFNEYKEIENHLSSCLDTII